MVTREQELTRFIDVGQERTSFPLHDAHNYLYTCRPSFLSKDRICSTSSHSVFTAAERCRAPTIPRY
jgi:hypothetical protein